MNIRTHLFASTRHSASWFAPVAVVVALTAAMTLAACGPRDEAPLAGSAAAAATPVAAPPPPVAPAVDPARIDGQPVPAVTGPVAALAGIPAYTNPAHAPVAPQSSVPADPAPQYQAAPVPVPAVPPQPVASNRAGSIASIEPIRSRPKGSGTGAVIGGVLGAVVGNQFGHGLGRAAMTGAGVVGGAVAGNNVERNYKEGVVGYRVSIRLDNGHTRTFERTQVGNLHVGDRVRLDANSFHRA